MSSTFHQASQVLEGRGSPQEPRVDSAIGLASVTAVSAPARESTRQRGLCPVPGHFLHALVALTPGSQRLCDDSRLSLSLCLEIVFEMVICDISINM